MKNKTVTAAIALSSISTALAHPGHSHSDLSTTEFAWHHLLTGGFVGVSVVAVVWFTRQALQTRKRTAARQMIKR